jgi:hypothetical protein
MLPIELTQAEQNLLKTRKQAVENSREVIALQVTMDTITAIHAPGPGWHLSSDLTQLLPPEPMAEHQPGPDETATIPTDGPR